MSASWFTLTELTVIEAAISFLYDFSLSTEMLIVLFGPLARGLAFRWRVPGFDSQMRRFPLPLSCTIGWVHTLSQRSGPGGTKIRAGQISTDHWSLASLESDRCLNLDSATDSRIDPKVKSCVTLLQPASRECSTNSIYKALRRVQVGSLDYVTIILVTHGLRATTRIIEVLLSSRIVP